jgi:hypothetical protein
MDAMKLHPLLPRGLGNSPTLSTTIKEATMRASFGVFRTAQRSSLPHRQGEKAMKGWKLGLIAAGLLVWTLVAIGSAQAASTWITCTPTESITGSQRIHVKCASAVGGIIFFALGVNDEAAAARALSVINTALVAGRGLTLLYDPADTNGTAIGCLASDCRMIQAIGIK